MKKVYALIIITAIMLSVISACAQGEKVSLLDFINNNITYSVDMKGNTVTICTEEELSVELFEQKPNTIMYDAILNRFDEIQSDYKCNIEIITYGSGQRMADRLLTLASTGDPEIDIIYGHHDNVIGQIAVGKILYPLTELHEYIDYENSEKFGTAGLLEAAMVNGIPYAVQPVQWLGHPNSFAYVICWNKDMFTTLGLPNLHEFYENETWTWDNFESIFELYLHNSIKDVNLITLHKPFFTLSALMANGVKFCDYDGEKFFCDIETAKSITAAEWALNLFNKYEDIISVKRDDGYNYLEFTDEKSIMTTTQTGISALDIPYLADFNFGLMPFPCGPDGVYGEWVNFVHAIRGFGISNSSDIPEYSAMILNDLLEPFSEISTENGLADYYYEQVFFSEIDTEIYLKTGNYSRALYNAESRTMWDFVYAFNGAQSASEIITSYASKIEEFVKEELQPNYENYIHKHLYGDK